MEQESFKYYAFISYSHRDKKIAQRLHKRLRSYHLPSTLIQSHPELPKRLGEVFLDEAALVAKEGSLTESLREYLDESNYLILICSPDSANSPYVNDEVKYFMKIGRRHHIVPLIVSGLPHSKDTNAECFVPSILELPRELEPLGIDLKTHGERDSFLRIIATTLALDLDNFISIEARERKKKTMILSSVVIVLLMTVWMFLQYIDKRRSDGEMQFQRGSTYYENKDYVRAIECYEEAAASGNALAQYNLGYMYHEGLGVEQDYTKAKGWFEKAVANGNATAQNNLGYMYIHGHGVEQDYTKARGWFEKAADNGDAEAQTTLGYMHATGLGVAQDYVKAIKWYEKAATQGDATAQNNLGYMYQHAQGVEMDYAKARELYEKAAAQGHVIAQINLGVMYEYGDGVERDYVKALEWYKKAADNGDEYAKKKLSEMNGKLTSQDNH